MDASERQSTGGRSVREQARDHLLLNFTDMGGYAEAGAKVIVRGEGCEVISDHGRRFIDGLSGLFCTNLGHSYGAEVGAAAARQLEILPFTPAWYLAHPAAAELAETLVHLAAPLGMQRAYFTNSGGEAVAGSSGGAARRAKLSTEPHGAGAEDEKKARTEKSAAAETDDVSASCSTIAAMRARSPSASAAAIEVVYALPPGNSMLVGKVPSPALSSTRLGLP